MLRSLVGSEMCIRDSLINRRELFQPSSPSTSDGQEVPDATTSILRRGHLPALPRGFRPATDALSLQTAGLVLAGWLILSVPAALLVGALLRNRNRPMARTAAQQRRLHQRCRCLLYTSDAADEEDS